MVALAALIVVIVALFLAAWGLRRRDADEVHSVEGYRHTLDTLHELRQRTPSEEEEAAAAGPPPPEPEAHPTPDQPLAEGNDDPHLAPGGTWVGRPVPHRVSRRFTAEATVHPDPLAAEGKARPAMPETPPGGDALPRVRADEPTAVHQALAPGGPSSTSSQGEADHDQGPGEGHDPGGSNGRGTVVVPVPGSEPQNGNNGAKPLFFDDTAGVGAPTGASLGELEIPPRRQRVGRDRQPSFLRSLSFSRSTMLVVVLAVMVAGLGAYVAYSQTSKDTTGRAVHTTTTKSPSSRHPGAGSTSTSAPPATTAPPSVAPISATAGGATYSVPGPSYTVDLTVPAGSCWVELTDTDTGQVLFSGTMAAGQQQAIPASGNTQLDIGAPHGLDVAINRVPVGYPPSFATPFLMAFRPS